MNPSIAFFIPAPWPSSGPRGILSRWGINACSACGKWASRAWIKAPVLRQKERSRKPILLCANSPRGLIEDEVEELERNGIPVYSLPDRTIRALQGLMEYGKIKQWRNP